MCFMRGLTLIKPDAFGIMCFREALHCHWQSASISRTPWPPFFINKLILPIEHSYLCNPQPLSVSSQARYVCIWVHVDMTGQRRGTGERMSSSPTESTAFVLTCVSCWGVKGLELTWRRLLPYFLTLSHLLIHTRQSRSKRPIVLG